MELLVVVHVMGENFRTRGARVWEEAIATLSRADLSFERWFN